jgi:hypothetical protein
MRRFVWILLLLVAGAPLSFAKKVTVQELKDTLARLHQSYTSDEDVANRLKDLELSEELTVSVRNSLTQYLPGPLTVAQVDILQGRSSTLAPPPADLPADAAPDAATQRDILAKAKDYVQKNNMQNPHLTATKTITRYQDDAANTSNTPGLTVSGPDTYTQLVDERTDQVESEKGIEKPAASKNKTKWGQNGQISEGEPGPNLSAVLAEASAGKLDWLRWQTIDGRQVAVFTFAVDKKKSHFDVNYCCFSESETQTNIAQSSAGVSTSPGDIQTLTSWNLFKKVVPYHGELFIEPSTGRVVRVVTSAEMKPADAVHREDMRIDYEQVVVGGKEYTLPAESFTINEVVPSGNSGLAGYTVRHTLFSVKYQGYH